MSDMLFLRVSINQGTMDCYDVVDERDRVLGKIWFVRSSDGSQTWFWKITLVAPSVACGSAFSLGKAKDAFRAVWEAWRIEADHELVLMALLDAPRHSAWELKR